MLFKIIQSIPEQVIWKRLYNPSSGMEKGTMYHLRNGINRTNVPTDPSKNMNAAEDFMVLIIHAHVVAAASAIKCVYPINSVGDLADSIVTQYVRLQRDNKEEYVDKVLVYSTEVLSLGLIWHGFHDATREGDGDRLLMYWRYLATDDF